MAAASVVAPPRPATDDCVVLHNVGWDTYERLLADDAGRRVPRIAYDRGVLELVTPSMPHEEDAEAIALLVTFAAANLGVPIRSVASTTFKLRDMERGFEADASFYVQSEERMRGQREVDLLIDPPPDVVLEMEMSRSALNKLALVAAMGIPEVWRCDGMRSSIFVLEEGNYREAQASLALPVLTPEELTRFLAASRTMLSPEWFQIVGEWAREQRTDQR